MVRRVLPILLSLLFLGPSLSAGPWNRIETEYTTIIFAQEDVDQAQSLASFADEVLLSLAQMLDHLPKERVPVILAGRPAWANGMFSPFPASITLYLTSPVDRFLGSRSSSWLRSLYTHELTHYLHLTSPVGVAKYLRFFGPEVPALNTVLMPGWWVEGISTYAESAFASGGRGDEALFTLSWSSPMVEDSLWTLSQGRYNSAFPPNGRIYTTGYLMVDYLVRHYGRESFARANATYAWFPFLGLNGALRKETGLSPKALFSLAVAERKAEIPAIPSLGTRISPSRVGDHYLPIRTELGLVGYSYSLERGGELIRYNEDGSFDTVEDLGHVDRESISLTFSKAVFSFVWADSFSSHSLPLASDGYSDLMLYDFSLERFLRITQGKMLSHPALSEDGTLLVAIEQKGDRYLLVQVDQRSGETSLLYENPHASVYEPQISPDKAHIVVVEIGGGNSSLLSIGKDGKAFVLVGPTRSEIRSPRFVDDESLLFVSDNELGMALYRYDFSTGEVEKLLEDPQGVLAARMEGDTLLYETYTAKGYGVQSVPMAMVHGTPIRMQESEPAPPAAALVDYPSRPYADLLRLNLVIPFPFATESSLQPGLYFHSQSLLRRHQLTGQAGWDLQEGRLLANLDYLYSPGSYSLGVNISLLELRRASVNLSLPLWYSASIHGSSLLSLGTGLLVVMGQSESAYGLSSSLGYQWQERSMPKDFFGSSHGSVSLGMQALAYNFLAPDRLRVMGGMAYQGRLFSSSQMVEAEVEAMAISKGSLGKDVLPYEGFSAIALDGKAKALLSVRYHIPLGLLDQPIPYGGLTGLGLSLSLQTALYHDGMALMWDKELIASARLTASMVLGTGVEVTPFVVLSYRVEGGAFSFTVGLDGKALGTELRSMGVVADI